MRNRKASSNGYHHDMPQAHVTAFFLFDVGDAIDLRHVQRLIDATVTARLSTRPPTPTYLQYQQPPVTIDGSAISLADVDGFRVRFKTFDYGVVSVALSRQLPDSWEQLVEAGVRYQEDPALAEKAERLCRELLSRIRDAIARPRDSFLSEDYLVFTITSDSHGETADALLASHGSLIAQLLRGERETLSPQERDEVLRHRISYYTTDMVIATWSSTLVYDTPVGVPGVLEILEFANSQLLEFRYYDQLLDAELARTYAGLQTGGWRQSWIGRRHARAARQVHALFIDVNELTDKTENALKIAGDVYAARLFAMTAARLGLDQWKANVREKLKTVDDIYRFAVEQTSIARGEFLELTIVLLIVLEIVLFMG
jgi:hypothetical protein